MSEIMLPAEAEELIRDRFSDEDIPIIELTTRQYPEETVFIVLVREGDIPSAAAVGNELDEHLAARGVRGFITVRAAPGGVAHPPGRPLESGLLDPRVTELLQLIAARSRASELQPSLSYVRDAAHNIPLAAQPRHHLIFGRRGAGKTSLMVEAKNTAIKDEHLAVWVNLQIHRFSSAERSFLWILKAIVDEVGMYFQADPRPLHVVQLAAELSHNVSALLAHEDIAVAEAQRLIPQVQGVIRRFGDTTGRRLYVFMDDFHYVNRQDQPRLLDMIHGCVRDTDAWLKVASIKHLSRWFQATPPMGLQTGHDADHIDLDVTLEDPTRAKTFLEEVLQRYANHVGIRTPSAVFSAEALNRLVLASGGVPRDYLVLSSAAVIKARQRPKARQVGVQDVTNAAGDAAQVKINELEEDLSSDDSPRTLRALDSLRGFLEETNWTYFRVAFQDKERQGSDYELLTNLLDARLLHLINPSVSDAHRAGDRYEAFMLDLSQFSGQRLKKYIYVLDFEGSHLVARQTSRPGTRRRGDTARQLIAILRRSPALDLKKLSPSE